MSAAAGALIGTLVTIPIQFIVGKVREITFKGKTFRGNNTVFCLWSLAEK